MPPGMCDLLISNVWHPRSVEAIKKKTISQIHDIYFISQLHVSAAAAEP
jgi:hypothetical protein